MTITVETGQIVLGANSYISLLESEAYHEARGREVAWTDIDDDLKEAALIRGTQAIEDYYRNRWIGVKTNNNTDIVPIQLLAWPRKKEVDFTTALTDSDGIDIPINSIPQQVKYAAAEAAFIELTTSILPATVGSDRYLTQDTIGPITQKWGENRPTVDTFPILDSMLVGLAPPGAGGVGVYFGLTDEETNQAASDPFLNPSYFNVI